jgi:hypothetical protein
MNSRSGRSQRTFPLAGSGAYSAGLSSSYGSGLGGGYGLGMSSSSAGYSFSSGYSPSYTSYCGYLTGSRPSYSVAPSSLSPGYTASKYNSSSYAAAGGSSMPPASATSSSSSCSYTGKRYMGAKTDSDLANGLERGAGSPWRSKSTDAAVTSTTNGYRERSLSRDPSNYYEPTGNGGYAASASRTRDHHMGRSERSGRESAVRDYTPSRDYRAGSFSGGGAAAGNDGGDGLLLSPLAPPRSKKPPTSDYLYRSTPPLLPPAYDSASRFSNATASLYRPSLSRSNSFHDLRDAAAGLTSPATPKAR